MAKSRKKSKQSKRKPARVAATPQLALGRRAAVQRKMVKKSESSVSFVITSHKARSEWFRSNVFWPFRSIPASRLVNERRRVTRALEPHDVGADWEFVGPSNIGGRMTCVVSHPDHADVIWAGAAGGGIWFSQDAGKTWQALWHKQESLNVGALAIDPNDPDVLYCGTGESNLSADSYPGVGLYKSTNGGKSWSVVARPKQNGIPPRIAAIAVDPFNSKHVLIGGVAHNYPSEPHIDGQAGLYESTDAGSTWKLLTFVSAAEYRCHAIIFHPSSRGTIYVTVTEQGADNGIWRSTNGGKNWLHLTQGLPSSELFNRTSLAIAPSKPAVLYAQAADSNGRVMGVFRTDNGGNTWRPIHGNAFNYRRAIGGFSSEYEQQMTYNNTIAVHPTDPDHVLCGGVDLHLTTDGGKNWQLVTKWDKKRGESDYAHADHHCLLMPAKNAGRVYDMNDGGMDVSEDGGNTWSNRSNGLAATMFYGLDVAQSNSDCFGGGAQDNGSVISTSGKSDDFFDITGGDGGFLVFDPKDENHIYASIYNLGIYRYPSAENTWEDVSPPASDDEKNSVWMAYIAMDPADSKTVFTGTTRVWRTQDDGKNWQPVSGFLDGVISAIAIAPADPKRIYVGTENGSIYRSLDGGDTWSGDLSSAELPNFKISCLITKPTNADLVIATVGNFGKSHVYQSQDGCLTWQDIDKGQLPDVPHNSLAIPSKRPNEVYVATDVGIFVSTDFGGSWKNLTGNLPTVGVIDIVYHNQENTLSAATYGRSIWRIKIR